MGRTLLLLALLSPALAGAAPESDEDDPAFARRPPPALPDDEPFPDLPPSEEDPGYVPAAPATAPAASPAPLPAPGPAPTAVRRVVVPADVGLSFRVGYRTWTLPEGRGDDTSWQRFHGVSVDAYPISWYSRFGLSTQVAVEATSGDWMATEGLVLGVQLPGRRLVPFFDAGLHVGLGTRTSEVIVPEWQVKEFRDHLTMVWTITGEVGVDARLGGSTVGTIAVGLQRSSYYMLGDLEDPLQINDSTSLTVKVGLGY